MIFSVIYDYFLLFISQIQYQLNNSVCGKLCHFHIMYMLSSYHRHGVCQQSCIQEMKNAKSNVLYYLFHINTYIHIITYESEAALMENSAIS